MKWNETKLKIGPIISLHVIVVFNPNSGVTLSISLNTRDLKDRMERYKDK